MIQVDPKGIVLLSRFDRYAGDGVSSARNHVGGQEAYKDPGIRGWPDWLAGCPAE